MVSDLNLRNIRRGSFVFLVFVLGFILVVASVYTVKIHDIDNAYSKEYNENSLVALRKFPYPYRAAMAISSDICGTRTLEEFLEIHKFINTEEMTSMGKGIGLEIGNSFFFYDPRAMSYFMENPEVAKKIRDYIRAGSIDTMHSYGDKSDFTREDAIRALEELRKSQCKVDVWTDHAKSLSNLGNDVTFGFGDHPESKAYHADLTLNYGIKFAWMGGITMVTGQSVPITLRTFTNIFDFDHPVYSTINLTKEFAKNFVGNFGNRKYALHGNNELVKVTTLDDGHKVYEFVRFDNYWRGVATGAFSKGLSYVISGTTLAHLEKAEGYTIVYTHLDGRFRKEGEPFIPVETQSALRNLANEFRAGNLYVTTTSKLLNYYNNHKYLDWSFEITKGEIVVRIHDVRDPVFGTYIPTAKQLQGITFYTTDRLKTRVFIGEKEVEEVGRNPADYVGRESVTIR
jgi:hypothetical protein